jgi:lincosamide nucleotidyltransferase A/C/D/E
VTVSPSAADGEPAPATGGPPTPAPGVVCWRPARVVGWWAVRSGVVGPLARALSHAIAAAPRRSPLRVFAPLRSRLKGEVTADRLVAIFDTLEGHGVRCWLAGGWGIDALAGSQSRRHDDVDVLVDDFEGTIRQACEALATLGFRFVERHDRPAALVSEQWTLEDGAHCRIDLLHLEHALLADALRRGAAAEGRPAMFTVGRVGLRDVPCLSAEAQRVLHSGFAPRTVDRHDLRVLSRAHPAPSSRRAVEAGQSPQPDHRAEAGLGSRGERVASRGHAPLPHLCAGPSFRTPRHEGRAGSI